METKQFKTLTTADLQSINGGDNESYDFRYRVGSFVRKNHKLIFFTGIC